MFEKIAHCLGLTPGELGLIILGVAVITGLAIWWANQNDDPPNTNEFYSKKNLPGGKNRQRKSNSGSGWGGGYRG